MTTTSTRTAPLDRPGTAPVGVPRRPTGTYRRSCPPVPDGRRRTAEQRRAFAELRALAGTRWRVIPDSENYPVIPCRYGQIEWFALGASQLTAYTQRPRLFRRVLAARGVRRHQIGDLEIRVLFPRHVIGDVALLLRARRRRHLSSEEARRRAAWRLPKRPKAPARLRIRRTDRMQARRPHRRVLAGGRR